MYLDKNYSDNSKVPNKKSNSQRISDVLLFKNHSDPQLRGTVRTLVASFIKAVSILSGGDYEKWILINVNVDHTAPFLVEEFIKIFIEVCIVKQNICIHTDGYLVSYYS